MNPFQILLLIIEFWEVIKEVVALLQKLNPAQRKLLKEKLFVANLMADQSDTSGLEDLLNGK